MNEVIMWSPGVTLEAIEKEVILKAFRFYRGNKTATASALDIAIRTLDNKLEKYELDGKNQENADAQRKRERDNFLARSRGINTPDNVGLRGNDVNGFSGAIASGNPSGINSSVLNESSQGEKSVPGANAGSRVESAPRATEKQAVPVSQREKVQVVLPKQAAQGGSSRRG